MKFSKYLRKCLAELEADPEHESDVLLVHLVKVQHLTQQISDWINREDEEDSNIQGIYQAPTTAYLSAFEGEIRRLRDTLPLSLKNHSAPLLAHALAPYQHPRLTLWCFRTTAYSPNIGVSSPSSTASDQARYSQVLGRPLQISLIRCAVDT